LIYSGWVNDSGDDGSMFLAISPFAGSMFVVIYRQILYFSAKGEVKDALADDIEKGTVSYFEINNANI
jgi:hypothetical protein